MRWSPALRVPKNQASAHNGEAQLGLGNTPGIELASQGQGPRHSHAFCRIACHSGREALHELPQLRNAKPRRREVLLKLRDIACGELPQLRFQAGAGREVLLKLRSPGWCALARAC